MVAIFWQASAMAYAENQWIEVGAFAGLEEWAHLFFEQRMASFK
jgi:hypothetical protein